MSKPESFILNSDFASLRNDGTASTTLVVPGSMSVGAGAVWQTSADLIVGQKNASYRGTIASTKESNINYSCMTFTVDRTGIVSGAGASYTVTATITRISETTVRVIVFLRNAYGSTLTTAAVDETFTFNLKTFISPFA